MIRCDRCRKLWPKGTVFCGSCGGSLGCRICPQGHQSPVNAKCCTTCGSHKLSDGVQSTNLRPRLSIALGLLGIAGVAFLLPPIVSSIQTADLSLPSLDGVLRLIFIISVAAFLFGGQKGRKAVIRFYWGACKLVTRALVSFATSLIPKNHDHHDKH